MPRGGFLQRGRGGGRQRDLHEVECYMCHKKGHLSCNCLQHTWNQNNTRQTPRSSQGRDAIVDDRSICNEEQTLVARSSTQTPQQQADTWLRGMATAGEDMQELVMRDLVGRERVFRMPEPIGLGEGGPQVQFCNSDYAIPIYAYPHLYQN